VAAATRSRALSFDEIQIRSPGDAEWRAAGYLEKREGEFAGWDTRHEYWLILDEAMKLIGYVSKDGAFFRFDEHGRRVHVATDSLERGLLKFFEARPGSQVRLVAVEPAP
jgi:hypothetical protein